MPAAAAAVAALPAAVVLLDTSRLPVDLWLMSAAAELSAICRLLLVLIQLAPGTQPAKDLDK